MDFSVGEGGDDAAGAAGSLGVVSGTGASAFELQLRDAVLRAAAEPSFLDSVVTTYGAAPPTPLVETVEDDDDGGAAATALMSGGRVSMADLGGVSSSATSGVFQGKLEVPLMGYGDSGSLAASPTPQLTGPLAAGAGGSAPPSPIPPPRRKRASEEQMAELLKWASTSAKPCPDGPDTPSTQQVATMLTPFVQVDPPPPSSSSVAMDVQNEGTSPMEARRPSADEIALILEEFLERSVRAEALVQALPQLDLNASTGSAASLASVGSQLGSPLAAIGEPAAAAAAASQTELLLLQQQQQQQEQMRQLQLQQGQQRQQLLEQHLLLQAQSQGQLQTTQGQQAAARQLAPQSSVTSLSSIGSNFSSSSLTLSPSHLLSPTSDSDHAAASPRSSPEPSPRMMRRQGSSASTKSGAGSGKKEFGCRYCEKIFTDRSNRKRHERIHTGAKPYHCEFCGKDFNNSTNAKSHRARCKAKKELQQQKQHQRQGSSASLGAAPGQGQGGGQGDGPGKGLLGSGGGSLPSL
eukprot:m.165651 g.165651  ORF g.165651 m.165651 type:complete len:522 (-) comp17741_c0_seq3:213-1778(-)